MAVVTTTDRPKSVRNRCVVEVFCGVFVLSLCFFGFPVCRGAFVIDLSQISSFFNRNTNLDNVDNCAISFKNDINILSVLFNTPSKNYKINFQTETTEKQLQ